MYKKKFMWKTKIKHNFVDFDRAIIKTFYKFYCL